MPKQDTSFLIVLRVIVSDPKNDDPRRWNYDDLLAPPEGETDTRFVEYVIGVKEDRA